MGFLYMPILKSKQGEQIALRNVGLPIEMLLPVIELLAVIATPTKTLPQNRVEYLNKTITWLVKAKFDKNPVAIDTAAYFESGANALKFLIVTCKYLQRGGINVVPVLYPTMNFTPETKEQLAGFSAVVIRIRTQGCIAWQIPAILKSVRAVAATRSHIHVLLDAQSLVGQNHTDVATNASHYVGTVRSVRGIRSVTFAGGSFPESLAGIQKGNTYLPRVEWQAWTTLRAMDGVGDIGFGDYAVSHPTLAVGLDPTKMNPAAAIRYARTNDWLLIKAGGVRTAAGGMGQYNQLCQLLLMNSDYAGETFSYGDTNYAGHTLPAATSGSFMTWRRDATSHHLARTMADLATLAGASGTR